MRRRLDGTAAPAARATFRPGAELWHSMGDVRRHRRRSADSRTGAPREIMLQAADARDLKLSLLTPQERECLRLVAQQRSSKEIANELGISKASVDTYCNRARAKLGVASRRDAAQLVLNHETASAAGPAATLQAPRDAASVATVALLPPISSLGPL